MHRHWFLGRGVLRQRPRSLMAFVVAGIAQTQPWSTWQPDARTKPEAAPNTVMHAKKARPASPIRSGVMTAEPQRRHAICASELPQLC